MMSQPKSTLSLLSSEKRQEAITKIIDYFATQRNEEIGVIAAEDVLDMFLEQIGPDIFNKGIQDAKELFTGRVQELDMEIEMLKKE